MNEIITMDMGDFIRRGIYGFIIMFAFGMIYAVIAARKAERDKEKNRYRYKEPDAKIPDKPREQPKTWKDF